MDAAESEMEEADVDSNGRPGDDTKVAHFCVIARSRLLACTGVKFILIHVRQPLLLLRSSTEEEVSLVAFCFVAFGILLRSWS